MISSKSQIREICCFCVIYIVPLWYRVIWDGILQIIHTIQWTKSRPFSTYTRSSGCWHFLITASLESWQMFAWQEEVCEDQMENPPDNSWSREYIEKYTCVYKYIEKGELLNCLKKTSLARFSLRFIYLESGFINSGSERCFRLFANPACNSEIQYDCLLIQLTAPLWYEKLIYIKMALS